MAAPDTPAARTPRVVIIGAGFGGLYAARALRRARAEITVIDRRNHHLFQPLLYQVATAGLSPGDIAYPIRAVLSRQRTTRVLLAEAQAAVVGLAACARPDGGKLREVRLAFFGVADRPLLAARAASVLDGKALDENLLSQAVAALEADFEPRGDLHASAATRRRLAGVLLRRVAKELLG